MTNSLCQVKLLNIFPSIPAVFSKATDQLKLSYKNLKNPLSYKVQIAPIWGIHLNYSPKRGQYCLP